MEGAPPGDEGQIFARKIGADYSRRWPNCNAARALMLAPAHR
jgi:hypothetical protein